MKKFVSGEWEPYTQACAARGKKKNKCARYPFLADCLNPQPTDNPSDGNYRQPKKN